MKFEEKNKMLVESLVQQNVLKTKSVIHAFKKTPRHLFVPKKHLYVAYNDIALPTFLGQTISQPYTVAVMLEALQPSPGNKILEIGTGSGWSTCLLSRCVGPEGKVFSMEISIDLIQFAKDNIEKLKLKNIELVLENGKIGYAKHAKYDRVLINAACEKIPKKIIDQTKINGRIIAPVNDISGQKMVLAKKVSENKIEEEYLGWFAFVPLM